ncbi:O-acetylhomoserine aminocarboxypropyltransferase [Alphaproteobacteria bacterium]|nr:O-acetylhomoserine aminocarboxypropyltransferase [Alphaproteobacteria bacterium]
MSDNYKFDTLSLHAGHSPDKETGSRAVPIYQTTSYVFKDTEEAAALYNMEIGGHLYSRISNPTVAALEQRLAALEGGVSAIACSSGMAAMHLVVTALCSSGDHIVASSKMYGANINLLQHTMPRFGITTDFVNPNDPDAIEKAIKPNTKMVFGEVIGNPGLDIMDVPTIAKICKNKSVPLVLDATFNTPFLMQPFSHGANIIVHSLTKWLGGHGIAIGGAIVNGGNFDWGDKEKFPTISGDHFALGGISFWEEFGPAALSMKIRAEGMYNFGPSLSPTNAFYLMQGIETLPLRMKKHMENTHELLSFLQGHELVEWVKHPDLETHPDYLVAKKILPKGSGSVVVFGIKGGRKAGQSFIESVQLASHLANVGDAKTLLIHPGSTTHSHLSAEAMKISGLTEDMIRLSVGLEDIDDIKKDFEKGFRAVSKLIK